MSQSQICESLREKVLCHGGNKPMRFGPYHWATCILYCYSLKFKPSHFLGFYFIFNNKPKKEKVVPKIFLGRLWILNKRIREYHIYYYYYFSIVLFYLKFLFDIFLVDMSFFIIYILIIFFLLHLPFFRSLNLYQLTHST